jgi:hypothetical protein
LYLDDVTNQNTAIYEYKIFNYGPSKIQSLLFTIQIPITYAQSPTVEFVNVGNLNATVSYKKQELDVNRISSKNLPLRNQAFKFKYINETANDEKMNQALLKLSKNQTIVLDHPQACKHGGCVDMEFKVVDFVAENEPVVIQLNISFESKEFGKFSWFGF